MTHPSRCVKMYLYKSKEERYRMLKVDKGIVTLAIPEERAMEIIQKLADKSNVVNGYIDISLELSREEPYQEVAEGFPSKDEWLDSFEEEGPYHHAPKLTNNVVPIAPSYGDYAELEEEETSMMDMVDDGEETGTRSIKDLSNADKEFLVTLYIKDIPTTAIMEQHNITKSALYSALERERIPRKGKLNRIIRRIEDGDSVGEILREEELEVNVMKRILNALQE